MTNQRLLISYDNVKTDPAFVMKLVQYLKMKGIDAIADNPTGTENRVKQELLDRQWLLLILTPETMRLPRVRSVVNAALEYVAQQSMQGVLALALTTEPIEPEDMPPLWSTIPMYNAGQNDEEHQRAFEKVCRTLSHTKVSVLTGTSLTVGNGVSQFVYNDARSSRHLPVQYQPAQKPRPRLIGSLFVGLALLIILVSFGGTILYLNKPSATPSPNVSATAFAKATLSAVTNATATINATIAATAMKLYNTAMQMQLILNDPMSKQDSKYLWAEQPQNPSCVFNSDGKYHITNTMVGHYTPCMATKTNFTNFAYQVQMTIERGDAGGLIFRSDDAVTTFYRFSLALTGEYLLFVCPPVQVQGTNYTISGGHQLLKGNISKVGRLAPVVKQPITLTVIVQDKTIYLYVRGMYVGQMSDSTITTSGEIGLYAASVNQPTEVAFSDVKVWMLS